MNNIEQRPAASDLEQLERSELDAMVQRLSRSPRLASLLRFIGDHYFHGEIDQLREHNIAIQVFGRPQEFDPAEDAIARVEAHRLRKKLKEYYALDGRHNAVQIAVPAGTYIPQFIHQAAPGKATAVPDALEIAPEPTSYVQIPTIPVAPPFGSQRRVWFKWALGITLPLVVLASIFLVLRPSAKPPMIHSSSEAPTLTLAPIAAGNLPRVVRLLAGYNGPPHPDPSGAIWEADHYFEGGGGWRGSPGFTARTNDPVLFQTIRSGDAAYAIPLPPGVYELHLYFVEPSFGPGLGGGEGSRTFNVFVNGKKVLPGFDVESDAMGLNVADERVFKDAGPASDGKLHVSFESQSGKPLISGLAVVPSRPHKQNPIRLTMQANPYIDHAGHVWNPDNYYSGGQVVRRLPATGTADPDLFSGERWGHFDYAIPVDGNGLYSLTLYFAERYFGPQYPGAGGIGSRRMNVMCNGEMLLRDFDIFREVGAFRVVAKTFHHLKPSAQGKLNILFEPVSNYGVISALEVEDESE